MIRALVAVLAGASLAVPMHAETITLHVFGAGIESCASWLANPANMVRGEDWILGAWTGMNFKNEHGHEIGGHLDSNRVIVKVKEICLSHPSFDLGSATFQAYEFMENSGR